MGLRDMHRTTEEDTRSIMTPSSSRGAPSPGPHLSDADEIIKLTINTLLGGAFLLEVDPQTSVRQLKDILSQMQGIPARQQTLVHHQKVLHDDDVICEAGIKSGANLSLVLAVNAALTNVVHSAETSADVDDGADWLDVDSMEMFDVTGMCDHEQDELINMLFGPNSDSTDPKQGFILCRDGDKISMVHLGAHHVDHHGGSRAPRHGTSAADAAAAMAAERSTLQQRLVRLQENTRHRIRMTELQMRMQQRAYERRRRLLSGRAARTRAAVAMATPPGESVSDEGRAVSDRGDRNVDDHLDASRTTCRTPHPPSGKRDKSGGPVRALSLPPVQLSARRRSVNGLSRSSGQSSLPPWDGALATPDTPRKASGRRSLAHTRTPPRVGELCTSHGAHAAAAVPARRSLMGRDDVTLNTAASSRRTGALPAVTPALMPRRSARGGRTLSDAVCVDSGAPSTAYPSMTMRAGGDDPVCVLPPLETHSMTTSPQRGKNRCWQCSRRLKIAATYECRCGGTFCSGCRHPETHTCSFDYKTEGRRLLSSTVPLVKPPKLPKI